MKGLFVSNAYLHGAKFSEPASMLASAAAGDGIGLKEVTNADLVFPVGGPRPGILDDADFVLFWDKDVRCARNIELCGVRVFNTSSCIAVCDDKSETHLALSARGVPSIETLICPMSFGPYDDLSFLESAADTLGFPMVVKDCFGSFGQQVRLAKSMDELRGMFSGAYIPRILQRYIECGSTDIRVEVVGGEAIIAVRRRGPEGDFRSNTYIGGRMERYSPDSEALDLAVDASEAVGADFCGVDIIESPDGPVVCEVNSNAHIRNLLDCTGRDVSHDILAHIRTTMG